MPQELTIRAATLDDLEVLLGFQQGVVAAERPFDPTLKPGELQYYDIEELIKAPHVYLVVAEYNQQLIASGYARIQAAKPYLLHDKYAYLGFIYVRPEYRGQGVSTRILAALKQWAQQQGLTEMRLEVYSDNTAARRAYEKFGFSAHMLEMRAAV
ncbi:GNAT family N-acetyltransferase [Hymenobacter terrenus]|uniref:GNAT family N-acetyltransferase n=1 Tax=Hymenobacter terrenus TaxID=1629124 RepID=UPI000619FFDE|nr:GNAT family N-acetyltransferase [Hymenobacter terrenus]